MKLTPELIAQIKVRHEAGQSDPAIAEWLAALSPPIVVGRDTIWRARNKVAEPLISTGAENSTDPGSTKASGATNRRRVADRTAGELADHEMRGAVILGLGIDNTDEETHLFQLRILRELQVKINADSIMNLPEKSRHTTAIAQAMAKLRRDAEDQERLQGFMSAQKRKDIELRAREDEIKLEEKRLKTLRAELEAKESHK